MTVKDAVEKTWDSLTLGIDGNYHSDASQAPIATGTLQALSIPLAGAGRIGFYVDYSERSTVGTHRFYICRTHGSAGSVSVDFESLGDSHTSVTGTLTWGDGELDVKWVDVSVPSKSNGEHRIYLQLSNATGGAVLHFGEFTRAHGVIDDDSVPADSDAVFYNADAVSNGTGTAASPYNSIQDAIADVEQTTKRYLCGRGTTVVDATYDDIAVYSTTSNAIAAPTTRTGENDRLIIRAWPGFTWRITGDPARDDVMAFIAKNSESYHTYKKIQIDNMNSRGGSPSAGIWYANTGPHEECTFELLNIFEIDSEENTAGISFYGDYDNYGGSAKVWRCEIHSIRRFSNADPGGSSAGSGVLSYDGVNISVQCCTFSNMNAGVFQKNMNSTGQVSPSVRFCLNDNVELDLGASGGASAGHSWTIIQSCIFLGYNGAQTDGIKHNTQDNTKVGVENYWCNNVLYKCGNGAGGAVNMRECGGVMFFNNILKDCGRVWVQEQSSQPVLKYADYNHINGITGSDYMYQGVNRNTPAILFSETGYGENDVDSDPLFTDEDNGDFTLQGGSPSRLTGAGGIDKGFNWTGIESGLLGARLA